MESDVIILVIDGIKGLTLSDQKIISLARNHHWEIIFVINKIDKIILDLQMGPEDTFLLLEEKVSSLLEIDATYLTKIFFASGKYNILVSSESLCQKSA